MPVSSRLSRLRAIITTAAVVVAGVAVVGVAAPAQAADTSTWTGAESTLWSDPGNWGGVAPVPGSDLVFPADAAATTAVNDFAAGTSFGALSIEASGYAISGNAVTLTVGLDATYASGTSVIGLDVSGSSGSVIVGGGGVLEVNGSVTRPVVLAGGTLSGTGTLNGSGITGSSASTVDPGPSGGSGILRYSANTALNLPAYSTYHVDLDGPTLGTGYDQVKLTSGSALFNPNNATLDVGLGYLPAVNTSFQIVSQTFGSPITGRFNGISQFGSFVSGPVTFSVGYFNSGIILTVVAVNVPTRTWDGGGTTSNWSEAANWVGDVAPSFAAALVFPAGAAKLASVNDLEPGLRITSLTIGASGYELSGASIDLLGTARATYVSGTSSIALGLVVNTTRTVEVDTGGTLLISAPVSGAGGLVKTSAGTLRITGTASSFTGATAVDAGRLTVDGSIASSSAVQVATGATLGGDGTLPAVSVSGRLDPGVLSAGNLSLASGSELAVGLAESDSDLVDVAGTVQLSTPTLSATLDHTPVLGNTFTIVDNDGSDSVVGTFAGLPEGDSLQLDDVTLEISYVGGTGNDIVLTTTTVPTTTTVTSSQPTTVAGESVTFTATTVMAADDIAVPSGAIRFLVGGDEVQAATAVDEDGQVAFTTDSLPVGDTTVVAEYTSSTGYGDSEGDVVQTVGVAETSTTLTVPDGPFVVGESVDLSATVSATAPGGGTPTGDVTFYDGDTLLGTDALDDSGVATWSETDLAAGTHSLTAVYEGGTDHTSSTSDAVERTVVKRTTSVAVTSGPSTPYGEDVTFTATVMSSGEPVSAGTVRFLIEGEQVQAATAVEDDGTATFTMLPPVGDTTVSVEYSGNGTFAASNGSRTHTVTLITTTTTLSVPAGALVAGQSVELSATVSAETSAGGTPVGDVTFYDGQTVLGTEAVDGSGVATLSTSDLAAGPHNLTAVYGGGTYHFSSDSAAVERTVVKRTTTVGVTSGPATSYGGAVTFTAAVTSGGDPVSAGTLRFLVGGDQVQAATPVDGSGRATFTTSSLPVGDTMVTAEYAGTATLADSSGSRTHTVTLITTTTTVRVTATSLVATVFPVVSGTVSFTAGGTPVGTAPLVDGVATLATTLPAGRAVEVVATYAGSATHAGSTSSTRRADPTITARITASKSASKHGWYRTPVTVGFTCAAGSAALAGPCPAPVRLDRSGRGQSVQRTIAGADGGSATATVTVNIDRKAPKLRVKRTGNKLRCKAKDPLSGIATCKIRTKAKAGGVVTWVAKATDRAGNVTTRRGHYRKG